MKLKITGTYILLAAAGLLASSAASASENVVNSGSASDTLRNMFKSSEQSEVLGDSSDVSKFDQTLPSNPAASDLEIQLFGGGSATTTKSSQKMRNLTAAIAQEEDELVVEMARNIKVPKVSGVLSQSNGPVGASEIPEPGTTAALFLIVTSLGFARRHSSKS